MSIFKDENDAADAEYADPLYADAKRFKDYVRNSTVTYFTKGAYSVGYRLKINDLAKSGYNVISLNNTEETLKCGQLFLKLVPIFEYTKEDAELPALRQAIREIFNQWDKIGLNVSKSRDFLDEVRIQTDVYKKTNNNLEAVCPAIVYSNIYEAEQAKSLLSILINNGSKDKNNVLLETMKSLYEANNKLKLGIIAMPLAENYDTLSNVMSANSGTSSDVSITGEKQWYLYLVAYELLRLFEIGYMHGDSHMNNILVNTEYKCNKKGPRCVGRCLLIDFGLAFKQEYHLHPTFKPPDMKLRAIANVKNPQTGQNALSFSGYRWLVNFALNEPNFNSIYNELKESIESFQEEMITKIKENYPGLIERIRAINSSEYNRSILRGGRGLVDTASSVNMNINTNNTLPLMNEGVMEMKNNTNNTSSAMKINFVNKKEPLTNKEFENIFNPSNMDMNEIVDKYENTLREGIRILDKNITSGGRKHNGYRKMKPVKMTTRSKRIKHVRNTKRSKRSIKRKQAKKSTR